FAALHGASSTTFGEPGVLVGLGPLGLSYILRAGGRGYFRRGAAAPHIEAGELEVVEGAPEFTYPAYAVYPEAGEARADIQEALRGLKEVVK
ncbi:LysR family transcriptional regulator, partial [Mesorhizobium sp. M2C.T.Ca.TU.002.02.1.1]